MLRATLIATTLLCLPALANAQEPAAPEEVARPRYHDAIVAELEALSIHHTCEALGATRVRCSFRQRAPSVDRELSVGLIYSDDTDTIYVYVEDLLSAPAEVETTASVIRRLMELNWRMLVGKFEWNEADGEVRLSMVLNTDSNFDRRAFRSIIRQLVPLADRYIADLRRLAGQ